jgi:alkanesulfonate monooxygenase SsuD/methylene tetrahydromethanopterin reductase-like flavin-dependent oxidoreductase (luciferase family)
MKFGILYELALPLQKEAQGHTEFDTYWEAIEQIKLAEEIGFDYVWAVEHHFLDDLSRCSSPEVFLAAVAQHTSRIRIGHGVVLLPPPFNHPIRVAERIGALDILSRGRVDLGTGRSITMQELGGFEIDPDASRPLWDEAIRAIPRMWTEETYGGFDGEFVKIPPGRRIVPKPVQQPHPPLWMACSSPSSFEIAGRYGLGVLAFTVGLPQGLAAAVSTYRAAISHPEPVGSTVNNAVAAFTVLHCGPDDTTAKQRGGLSAVEHFGRTTRYFGEISAYEGYREYRSMAITGVSGPGSDGTVAGEQGGMDELIDAMAREGVICVGGPRQCIETLRKYEAQGVDQFIGCVQFGSLAHGDIMEGLRTFGTEVMPEFSRQ